DLVEVYNEALEEHSKNLLEQSRNLDRLELEEASSLKAIVMRNLIKVDGCLIPMDGVKRAVELLETFGDEGDWKYVYEAAKTDWVIRGIVLDEMKNEMNKDEYHMGMIECAYNLGDYETFFSLIDEFEVPIDELDEEQLRIALLNEYEVKSGKKVVLGEMTDVDMEIDDNSEMDFQGMDVCSQNKNEIDNKMIIKLERNSWMDLAKKLEKMHLGYFGKRKNEEFQMSGLIVEIEESKRNEMKSSQSNKMENEKENLKRSKRRKEQKITFEEIMKEFFPEVSIDMNFAEKFYVAWN
ncbi:hypothetical protein ROZALSC1DRAFT_25672, partial [Rozella allomycis CSF55]